MSKTICRICLRTDLKVQDIEETLVDFHDEITDYAINENEALKYCSVCEYLLRKCYNFREKCRQANIILNEFKINKNKCFPNNLHTKLSPLLVCSIPNVLQQFDLVDGTLIPLTVQLAVIKHENDTDDDLDTNDNAQVVDSLQTNADESDLLIDNAIDIYMKKLQNKVNNEKSTVAKLVNIDLEDEDKPSNNIKLKNTSEDQQTFKIELNCDESNNALDTDITIELNKELGACKTKARKKDSSKVPKTCIRKRKPLQNMNEIEKVFEVQLFATYQEAKAELEQRKTSMYYLAAQHKCEICHSVFRQAKMLIYHMRWHDESAGSCECDVCSMRFKNKVALRHHKNTSHFGRFQCKKCPMITYFKETMFKHFQQHAGKTFECKQCARTYTHISTYNTHMRVQHKTEHECVTCARTFVSEKGLIAHRGMIHNTTSLVDIDATARCEPCGLTFANEQVYTIHLKNTEKHKELANEIIACSLCGARFEDIKSLKEHKRSHNIPTIKKTVNKTNLTTEEDNFKCAICGVEGTSIFWVYKHVQYAHPDSPYATDLKKRQQYMCDTCGKCYTSRYMLRDHLNVHAGLKPYSCKLCLKSFTSRLMLRLHEDWHAPAKRECKRCGKKFVSVSNLSNHMRSHIKDRRYKCSVCHKAFYHSGTLREHIQGVHNNVRRVRKLVKREDVSSDS